MKKIDICQEDIASWTNLIIEAIEEKVPMITDKDLDPLIDDIYNGLNKFFHYPEYRNYN